MVACSHGCLHLQVFRLVRVSCRWRCLCFSEPSNFLKWCAFEKRGSSVVFFALFALRRCWIFVGLSFVGRAFHSNAFLLVFDSASAFRGEKRQRQTHGAENSVAGASRFDVDAHAPSRQVFARKTRSRKNASEHRKRTRCASRSDSPKLVVPILAVGAVEVAEARAPVLRQVVVAKSGAPSTWRARRATLPLLYTVRSTRQHFSGVCALQQTAARISFFGSKTQASKVSR